MDQNEINRHKEFMKQAYLLADRGKGYVNPNPLVGCVIVKMGKLIGSGYHKKNW